jgi:hypothetical protein
MAGSRKRGQGSFCAVAVAEEEEEKERKMKKGKLMGLKSNETHDLYLLVESANNMKTKYVLVLMSSNHNA